MQRMKIPLTLLIVLSVFGFAACAQTAPGNGSQSPASGVSITIAPAESASQASHSLTVNVTVTNNTNRVLVDSFPIQLSPVEFEIRNTDGVVPTESDLGCKRHMSTKCGPSVKLGGPVNFTGMVVLPGQTKSINYDLGREYRLDTETTLVVDVLDREFVPVDPSGSVMEYPQEIRNIQPMNYERYSYTKLDTIRSNTITVQVPH
jgi:hypothetical protein